MASIAKYNPELWTCSSNEALKVAIVNDEGAVTFHPTFTYPIFGESEQIFGFVDLQLNLAFNATTMLPLLGFKYLEKLPDDSKIEDPQAKLREFLPGESLIVNDESKWAEDYEEELKSFKVPGELIGGYIAPSATVKVPESQAKEKAKKEKEGESVSDKKQDEDEEEEFEVYRASLDDENAREFHRRIQIFVLLFIEAGSYIDETDEKWEYYFVFEKKTERNPHPKFIGFTTVYSYWKYPGHELYDGTGDKLAPLVRKKISQFVILPPYQGKRHGEHFYKILVDQWLQDTSVREIVVEDPSEAFDDLRDRCDLERLSDRGLVSLKSFSEIPVPEDEVAQLQAEQKMEKRQFERCLEMILLHLNKVSPDKKLEKQVRLHIKRRLFKKNREALEEMEKAEKMDKLQAAYERLVEDYERITERVKFSPVKRELEEDSSGAKSKKKKV